MDEKQVILGLVDNRASISCSRLAEKCRDLTLTWTRYCYHGPILEDASVDRLLDKAVSSGAAYCLLLAYGQILLEQWLPGIQESDGIQLESGHNELGQFLVAGRILEKPRGWYGIDDRCLLVNLTLYSKFGQPSLDNFISGSVSVPNVRPYFDGDTIYQLEPQPGHVQANPQLTGWHIVAESLRQGLAVRSIEGTLGKKVLDLAPENKQSATHLAEHLNGGIDQYVRSKPKPGLSTDQITFLNSVFDQTNNAKRGVFLINIEPYTDVDQPPGDSWTAVSTLYSVAAGFKPNRILQTHGVDDYTRVVFFDYSPNALEIRKILVTEWDGDDFPHFVKYIFKRFPQPDTYYQLWTDRTPDNMDWDEVERMWQRELQRFGGGQKFKFHWMQYRKLKHEFVRSDIFGAPTGLLNQISPEKNAIIWFSNAPFTVYSNWRYTLKERRQLYEYFVSQLAVRNPDLLLYGADYTNTSVNCITASEYWNRYQNVGHDALCPQPLNRYQIRS